MTARPGYYWNIPFVWAPGCPVPSQDTLLGFRPAPRDWLRDAVAVVLATSLDPADQLAVEEYGANPTATALLAQADSHSEHLSDWWQLAETAAGEPVGFVLCSIFPRKPDRPREGTIYYLGVLPAHRGNGYARRLVDQATRTFSRIGVDRILCDTAAGNAPMIAAFRQAGYRESDPWERPLR